MKTLKSMLAGLIILFTCAAANAGVKHDQPSQTDVINIYINAVNNGKPGNLDKYLDENLQFNVKTGDRVNILNKSELLKYFADNGITNTAVNTVTTVMQQDDASARIKVQFKYDGYTRTDIVTLNKSFGWVITDVDSSTK